MKRCHDPLGGIIAHVAATEVAVAIESEAKRTMIRVSAMMMIREKLPYADDNGVKVPPGRIRMVTHPRKLRNITAARVIERGEAMFLQAQ